MNISMIFKGTTQFSLC